MSAEQKRIQDLAYQLWQEAGSPHGRDWDFWLQAEGKVKGGKPKAKAPAQSKADKPKAEKPKAPAKPKAAAPAAAKAPAAVKPKAPAKAAAKA